MIGRETTSEQLSLHRVLEGTGGYLTVISASLKPIQETALGNSIFAMRS